MFLKGLVEGKREEEELVKIARSYEKMKSRNAGMSVIAYKRSAGYIELILSVYGSMNITYARTHAHCCITLHSDCVAKFAT